MQTTAAKPVESKDRASNVILSEARNTKRLLAWSSLFFVLLQSVCTFFTALDGLRLLIGAGSLAVLTQSGTRWDIFHADWIRIPMIGFAFIGSSLNLLLLSRIRKLRRRPAAQWRQRPLTPHKIRMERVQLILSIITLALIGIEEINHFRHFHMF
jgi:hypothetical protein